jgi:hypothetical protein
MDARFTLEIDAGRDLVRVTMTGLFTPADVDAFFVARRRAHAKLTCGPDQHVTLNDVRGMKIQPQATVAAFQALLAAPEFPSRRLAFVVAPTLARSQLMRALDRRRARCFTDLDEAEAWLFSAEDDEPVKATILPLPAHALVRDRPAPPPPKAMPLLRRSLLV